MKRNVVRGSCAFALLLGVSAALFFTHKPERVPLAQLEKIGAPKIRSSFAPSNRDDAASRHEYEMRRLRDPRTQQIPQDIRARELRFAQSLPAREALLQKGGAQTFAATWEKRGPINVGGRTRALGIDLNYNGNSNRRILAGAVSGGMYLSEDDGATWQMTTTLAQLASATCLVQDPNNRNTWYYGTGELLGSTRAGFLSIPGQGIYKSTDGGKTWAVLSATAQGKSTQFDNFFDFVWNLAIRPQSGTIYAATLGAILRSTNAGANWTSLIVGQDANGALSQYTDVVVAANGDVYAALSRNGANLNNQQYGVFRSTNDGQQFSIITPAALVADPHRLVLAAAPSDPNTLYLLAQSKAAGAVASDHQLFRYNAANNAWTDLSASIPNEQGLSGNSSFSSQGGYDLIVKVKPDNANAVWIGGTNLYRSTNGGQSFTRVGGYLAPDTYASFENHHSDQHALAFFPNNANAMISGNDGGLSKATNALQQPQTWASLNNGYLATQFYAVALDPQTGSNFITGGTQDNGTWGTDVSNFGTPWASLFSGDGAYTDIASGGNPYYVSAQNGLAFRVLQQGNQAFYAMVKPVTPNGENDFLFICPFQLDPNDARVMYFAVANGVYRNSNLDGIPRDNENPTSINWSSLSNSVVAGNAQVTTLAVSKTPANRLYFGATDYQANTYLVRVNNAQNNSSGTNILPPGVPGGSYPSCIGVNPSNADELFAVFSNYAIPSLFYSSNGGTNWTNVEGNLAGDDAPSIRWASIVPTNSGKVYLLATSVGVYSTTSLNGANTVWAQEGATPIGNVVVDMIVARPADGVVVAGTHGRGVYSAQLQGGGGGTAVLNIAASELSIELQPGATRSTQFALGNSGTATLDYTITATSTPEPNLSPMLKQLSERARRNDWQASTDIKLQASEVASPQAEDVLILDDGDNFADDFIGLGAGSFQSFNWLNVFDVSGFNFQLAAFDFYMRTEFASSNVVGLAVADQNNNVLVQGTLSFNIAPSGGWYRVTLNNPITFPSGQSFAIAITAQADIPFPAGADTDAQVKNKSFYFDYSQSQYVGLHTISGFENAAFLVRAVGTKSGTANQSPVARAQVSKLQANVNETLTFNGSTSSDPDGQITKYEWNFGDNATSTQAIATHAYGQAGVYNFTLTVTDDKGATGQTGGQITVTGAPQSRLTANPTNGSVAANNAQNITVTYNAQGLGEGNYTGQLDIRSNGGNRIIPVRILVSNSVSVNEESELPAAFALSQNYPNPFAANGSFGELETSIRFALPQESDVKLVVMDLNGRELATLVAGKKAAGEHVAQWEGRDDRGNRVASGIYFYRLTIATAGAPERVLLKKLTVLK